MANPNEFSQPASYLNGGPFETTWGPYATKEAACDAIKNEVDADGKNMRMGKTVGIGTDNKYVPHHWDGGYENMNLVEVTTTPSINSVSTDRLQSDSVTKEKAAFIIRETIVGKNIFNKNQPWLENSRFSAAGNIETIPSLTSKVSAEYQPLFGLTGQLAKNGSNNNYVFYDEAFAKLTNGTTWGTSAGPVAIPSEAVYYKIQIGDTDNVNNLQIESGSAISTYEAFSVVHKDRLADEIHINKDLLKLDTDQLNDKSVTFNKTDFIYILVSVGKNVFNKDQVWLENSRFSAGGNVETNSQITSRVSAEYQPLFGLSGHLAKNGSNNNYAFYDSSFQRLSFGTAWGTSAGAISIPSGAVYYKIQINNTDNLNTLQVQSGSAITAYEPYTETRIKKLSDDIGYNTELLTGIKGSQIADRAITARKVSYIEQRAGKNIFNKSQPWLENSRFSTGGNVETNPVITSRVSANYQSLFGLTGTLAKNGSNNGYVFYNASFVKLANGTAWGTSSGAVQIPEGAVYYKIQVSNTDNLDILQIEKNLITEYEPFVENTYFDGSVKVSVSDVMGDVSGKSALLNSITGQAAEKATFMSMISGSSLTLPNFPFHVKKGFSMSFSCDVNTLLGSIEFGKGLLQYRGDWISIDSTKVYWKHYEQSESTKAEIAHGLTISGFVRCSIYIDDSSVCNVVVSTLSGYFKTTFAWTYEANFAAFIKTTGQSITNVVLNASCKDFSHPVWAFGDSYFGISLNRWPGIMKQIGFFNLLFDGLAGQVSNNAYTELVKCLRYGTPKYLIWCLGMNDSDAVFQATLSKLVALCYAKNITLILTTTPSVPSRSKEIINGLVQNSGFRYIDFYRAVGATSAGQWHAGFLDPDNVHPTALGAQALATQVLVDFPEIMQYGVVSTSGQLGETIGDR